MCHQFGISLAQIYLIFSSIITLNANVFQEVEKIIGLSQSVSYYADEDIADEIWWRIYYARKQYLYFLAASVGSEIILQMIPTLLKANRSSTSYSSALELLELSIKDQQFKLTISVVILSSPSEMFTK